MKKIELHNFRCFEHLGLTFSDKVNLLIGDNASGKTTLIRAISAVLNSFFVGFSDENTRFFGLLKDDFRIAETETGLIVDEKIKVHFQFLGSIAGLELHSKKGRTLQMPLEAIKLTGKEMYNGLFNNGKQILALPLFASFSTSDIHSIRKIKKETFKQYFHKPSFGYYECLQGDGFFPYWTKRLLVLKEGGKGIIELQCVQQAIQNALGKDGCNIISDMEIRHNQSKVYYHFTDGREIDSNNLSDGYKRLVNIVTDLAFRCALLNQGIYGEDACLKTKGTALIDEIDLHLHPTLQSVVVKSLQRAFPNLQFIITTHAPMVMTSIKSDEENIIYKLDYSKEKGYSAIPVELYGMDASSIIELELDTIPRSKEVDDELTNLFKLIDKDKDKEARIILNEMKHRFGENLPDLARAEAMLNFQIIDDDEKN